MRVSVSENLFFYAASTVFCESIFQVFKVLSRGDLSSFSDFECHVCGATPVSSVFLPLKCLGASVVSDFEKQIYWWVSVFLDFQKPIYWGVSVFSDFNKLI